MPRSHFAKMINFMLDKEDPGTYNPRHTAVEIQPKDLSVSPNQKQRRSLFFEGVPEIYMKGGQPNPESSAKVPEKQSCNRTVLETKQCIGSLRRVQQKLRDFNQRITDESTVAKNLQRRF